MPGRQYLLTASDRPMPPIRPERLAPDNRGDERFRIEVAQVVDTFADPDQPNRKPHPLRDGKDDSALCGAVELGQRDPRHADRIMKLYRLIQCVLTGPCVPGPAAPRAVRMGRACR